MSENRYLGLSDLLDRDVSSNEFYNTLSPELQRKLQDKDIQTFEELQSCAKAYRRNSKDIRGEQMGYYNPVSSSMDCTGLIPRGANIGTDDFEIYRQLYPFSNPPINEEQ